MKRTKYEVNLSPVLVIKNTTYKSDFWPIWTVELCIHLLRPFARYFFLVSDISGLFTFFFFWPRQCWAPHKWWTASCCHSQFFSLHYLHAGLCGVHWPINSQSSQIVEALNTVRWWECKQSEGSLEILWSSAGEVGQQWWWRGIIFLWVHLLGKSCMVFLIPWELVNECCSATKSWTH